MPNERSNIFADSDVRETVNAVEAARIARGIGVIPRARESERTLLRTSGLIEFADWLEGRSVESRLRQMGRVGNGDDAAKQLFRSWSALVDALIEPPIHL